MTDRPGSLSPGLYDRHYYLHSLPGLEYAENPDLMDPAARDTIRIGKIRPGQHVLDFGCGRGTCAAFLATYGCTVVGTDFSLEAIDFAREYARRLPEEAGNRLSFHHLDRNGLDFKNEFDVIVFNQVFEHLHDWELELLMKKFKQALKPKGRLVISTPNLDYIRYLFPLKRIVDLPGKMVKETVRVIRGKSRHAASVQKFLREVFKIRYPESEHTRLHINLKTPHSIRRFMERQGFRVQVTCLDRHTNPLSVITRRWWGETIWVNAEIKTT